MPKKKVAKPKAVEVPGFGTLPPDCYVNEGVVIRKFKVTKSGFDSVEEVFEDHTVASSMEEARENRSDYYSPSRGWLLEGWKWQSDPGDRKLDPAGAPSRFDFQVDENPEEDDEEEGTTETPEGESLVS